MTKLHGIKLLRVITHVSSAMVITCKNKHSAAVRSDIQQMRANHMCYITFG